ncbi:MAG TPA: alpha/beta fold hydrolase [Bryobacteraceae bacterium]|jgi:pimeloyl-ACP methyl ester carboxylesterase|nr:alpha/beta fold hydrolase [Bryobacteraceae bacterium]
MHRMSLRAAMVAAFASALITAAPKTEIGSINGAAFRIDVPENWNGSLVIYCHGYAAEPVRYDAKPIAPFLAVFTDEGYAVAQSGYAAGGWAVEQAVVDTESLRRYFLDKYGKPRRTIITGHSMGGFLTMMLMERYPTTYDAALPLCGPLAAPEWFMSRGAFDSYVLFNYYFPGILPEPTKIPKEFVNNVNNKALIARIEQALDSAPEKAASLRHFRDGNLKSNKDLAGTTAFLVYLIKELNERAGGNPFDNRNTIYNGTLDDPKTNAEIKRYAADPKAQAYLQTYYTPTGRIVNPMLAIHTSYDPLVPVWIPNSYQTTTENAGDNDLFVQQYVNHDGHCAILPNEIRRGFSELLDWKEHGVRPPGGEVPER